MMIIRRAGIDDAATLSALNVDVQRIHAAAWPHIFKRPASDDYALEFMREQLADEVNNYFFIAEQDGEAGGYKTAVGYIFARIVERPENPFMYAWKRLLIDQISVRPACQGHGAGKLLIQAVRDLAQQRGIDTISLECWEFNQAAQRFFRKEGFETINVRMWLEM